MSIVSVLREECLQIRNDISSKEEVLQALAGLACNCDILKSIDKEQILDGLRAREEIASTGFENGIAIPHCFINGLADFVVGILIVPDGVDFNAVDGEKTSIFIFMVGPEGERSRHIRYLSNISHTLKDPDARNALLKSVNPVSVYENFIRHATLDTGSEGDDTRCLFLVIIDREELFQPVLEIICATENGGISIMEGSDANSFLYKIPLFSSVLDGELKGFSRIIVGEVSRQLANEMIRKIDLETGDMPSRNGVMIVFLENVIISGTLSA